MNTLPYRLFCSQKFASCVLLLGMLFQLGACPCGCLEHNIWFQLIGLDSEHQDHTPTSDSAWDAEHHECTGEVRAQYVNNARSVQNTDTSFNSFEIFLVVFADSQQACPGYSRFYRQSGPFALAHALSFSTLQVYRL